MKRSAALVVASLIAVGARAAPPPAASPQLQGELSSFRDQLLAAVEPCDRTMAALDEQLGLAKPGTSQGQTRTAADEADRRCEAARSAFATLKTPTSLDPEGQAKLKEAGQKLAGAMAIRRRAVSAARDYLLKADKATAELYRKRLEAAQVSIQSAIESVIAMARERGVDLTR